MEKCLVPTLSKGDIVVMDNLSSHKGPRVEQLINCEGPANAIRDCHCEHVGRFCSDGE